MRALCLVLLLPACSKSEPPPPPAPPPAIVVATPSAAATAAATAAASAAATATGCIADTYCVITTFHGCCECDGEPHAESKRVADLEAEACRITQCAQFPRGCPKVTAPGAFRAVCKTGACTAQPK